MDESPSTNLGANPNLGDETYHLRHPLLPVQQLHRRPPPSPVSSKDKENQKQLRQANKQRNGELLAEIDDIRDLCDKRVQALIKKYPQKDAFIRASVFNVSSYTPERKVNAWNAEVSYKAKELHGGIGGLEQARAEVIKDRAERKGENLAAEELAAVLKHAHELRTLKKYGARPTNRSAAKDASETSSRIESELKKLSSRTGAAAVFIASRSHINDAITPVAFESENASGFCKKVLGHALSDVGGRLEAFNIVQNRGAETAQSSKDLRKRCVGLIINGLREITGKEEIAMNYQNYETGIVSRYKVKLVGWPPHIPFANPSCVKTEHLQRLYDALQSLECRWQVLSRDEIAAHNSQYDITAVVGKKRKERSDKGRKRVGARSTEKRRKDVTRQIPPRSADFIPSDSEDVSDG